MIDVPFFTNITGDFNTAIGFTDALLCRTGVGNTALGAIAPARMLTTADNNIYIGSFGAPGDSSGHYPYRHRRKSNNNIRRGH